VGGHDSHRADQPGTKAAIYQLLAGRPGLAITRSVTDPLGRTGVAVTDGGAYYLLIDPQTAQLLAFTTYPCMPTASSR
jgi:hypothetical protein